MNGLRARVEALLSQHGYLIITVASFKGGVGKTTLAIELAHHLNAILCDLDWNEGNASRALGHRHDQRVRAPLLDAIEKGRPPMLVPGAARRRPDLVPCHPDFQPNEPGREQMADLLTAWAKHWGRVVVVDTHPGDGESAFGAVMAAHLTLTPALLETKPLDALEQMLNDLAAFPLLVVPNAVPSIAPSFEVRRLGQMTARVGAPVSSPVSAHRWLKTRKKYMPVSAAPAIPRVHEPYVSEINTIALEAVTHVERAAAA
ncbi:ParA family protein [Solihabitans fulvus]|uniref:ParA family protein n=1 Tax=Solihabitans fulvus TaxID=1892852 RepID=A0A5B2W6P5_9PSEU|nr:ParA family protein [Solihabitans fulvus]KAA2245889.1 ParA family protein [Solihabitans fulvus]